MPGSASARDPHNGTDTITHAGTRAERPRIIVRQVAVVFGALHQAIADEARRVARVIFIGIGQVDPLTLEDFRVPGRTDTGMSAPNHGSDCDDSNFLLCLNILPRHVVVQLRVKIGEIRDILKEWTGRLYQFQEASRVEPMRHTIARRERNWWISKRWQKRDRWSSPTVGCRWPA